MNRLVGFFRKIGEGVAEKLLVIMIVAAATAVGGYLFGYASAQSRYEWHVEVAPFRYVALLKDLVDQGAQCSRAKPRSPDDIRVYARSIVSVRDDLRRSVTALSGQLNSEMDRIATLLEQYEKAPTEQGAREITLTIRVLRETWPAKEAKIADALRKILADAGITAYPRPSTGRP